MGGNDRHTRTLSVEELQKLAEQSAQPAESEGPLSWDDLAVPEAPAEAAPVPEPRARTATRHDPLTAALLAEASRDARTMEFDPAELAKTLAEAEGSADEPPLPHPKLKRRDQR